MKRYENKIAVVVGAAHGIGFSMVERLVEEGAAVAALDLEPEIMIEKFSKYGEKVYPVFCDVSNKQLVEEAISKVLEKFGRIDVALVMLALLAEKVFWTQQKKNGKK